ncbi:hypothetical protein [Dysgonomonas sp. 25]|uniref:hypothetical protein n=1 Tax=Dysgonomonas sp. 25 TaxID=2302933 RepID=UPI0013D5094B|nr:hypothetical protein [Dysgonomonas sp. 25]NDV68623.1 hypothetical protein [Dysgonomonas sp. 25]
MENIDDTLTKAISNNEPIKGKDILVGRVLEIIHKSYKGFSDKEFLDVMKEKIMSGKELTDYERHIFVDVLMFHRKMEDECRDDTEITPRKDN